MLMLMNLTLSFIFIFLNHPMIMGLILLLQTITISMITGLLNLNFWFSYILFLIMVGGMLVLFIYMTSIASNEMFNYSNMILLIIMFIITTFMILYSMLDMMMVNMSFMFLESIFKTPSNYNLSKYFNYPSMLMIFFMISYLFITLIAVVKITKIEHGPLRHTS